MLHKSHRLAKTKDVQMAFAKGRSFFNPFFTLKYLGKPGQIRRFTVVVSAKTAKKAVDRNRMKRILREFIRLRLKHFRDGDYAIAVKPRAFKEQEGAALKEFEKLLIMGRLIDNEKSS